MQTAVRKRAAVFDFWGHTPTPKFRENSHERGPRSPAGTAQGFDPPLGATPERGGHGADGLRRSQAGGGALAAVCLGGRGAGRQGRGGCPLPGRGGRRRGKMAAPSAACVGFQATSAIEAAGGRKSPFLPYKEALFFRAQVLSNQSCFTPESLSLRSGCFFDGAE